jgi:hypothetical protein
VRLLLELVHDRQVVLALVFKQPHGRPCIHALLVLQLQVQLQVCGQNQVQDRDQILEFTHDPKVIRPLQVQVVQVQDCLQQLQFLLFLELQVDRIVLVQQGV